MTISFLLLAAFGCGFLASRINLPPLVGYLVAGFLLNAFGVGSSEMLQELADLGILLLLFSIGLKLKISSLMRKEIWGCGSLHMAVITGLFGCLFLLAGYLKIGPFSGFTTVQAMLLGFALSFSSTVFAVKTFEDRGDIASLSAVTAVGILIIQDIAAVIYLTFTTGKYPSPYALLLIPALFLARPLLLYILDRCGHKELLLLFGLFTATVLGALCFSRVDLKPDLGALFVGIILSQSTKAKELSETLLSLKDLLLVGFFLNIGLSDLPTVATFATACFFILLLPVKSVLYFLMFNGFKLRARTSLFSTLALANYSEFGLLVSLMAVQTNTLSNDWVVTTAIALSFSFLLSAPLNTKAHLLYGRFKNQLLRFQSAKRLPYDRPHDTANANIIIFGMGRIGTRAYDTVCSQEGCRVVGIDFNEEKVARHRQAGRNVLHGDATDIDLWEKISTRHIRLAMLTMESHTANLEALQQLRAAEFEGDIAAIATFEDEREELLEHGAAYAYDLYQEAGRGFADGLLMKYSEQTAAQQTIKEKW